MKTIRIYINGWFVAETEYKLPVNWKGEQVQLPDPDAPYGSNVLSAVIGDPHKEDWYVGDVRLGKFQTSPPCKHQHRTPKGLCTDCGSMS